MNNVTLNNPAKLAVKHAYFIINQPTKINKKYREIPHTISNLKTSLRLISINGEYCFTPKQNDLIHKLSHTHHRSWLHQLSAVINGPAFFHS